MTRNTRKPTLVAVYRRVSTAEQAQSGLGLSDPLERCRAYVRAMGMDDDSEVRVFTDAGVSAKSLERPALGKLMELVEKGRVKSVVVLKTDRIARRTIDLLRLVELFDRRGVSFASVREQLDTSSSTGRLVLTILGAVAQAEREAIAERTKAAIAAKLRQGYAHGWCPLGWVNRDGRLIPDAEEQETISIIVELRELGLSLRAIAAELQDRGRTTKRGGRWGAQNIANVWSRHQAEAQLLAALHAA